MQAEHEKKFLASRKREPAFISIGYMYWKEATTAFEKHQLSATHREAVESLVLLPSQLQGDIGEMCDGEMCAWYITVNYTKSIYSFYLIIL